MTGDPDAATLLGDLLARAGPQPNYVEAADWYRRAAETGHQPAARALASLYLTGAGVAQDREEAAKWLRVAADAGDQASQVDLANLVLQDGGDREDPQMIARWFIEAAKNGDLVAAFNVLSRRDWARTGRKRSGFVVAPSRRRGNRGPVHVWAHARGGSRRSL